MRRFTLPFYLGILFALSAHTALAQNPVSYVSMLGNLTNPCSAPNLACITLQRGIDRTNAGGVVRIISPGSYGTADITKGMSIIADGVDGAIVGATIGTPASAVQVRVPATDVVTIRGVLIDPLTDINRHGIYFSSGAALHVQNCLIRRGAAAIFFRPSAADSELTVSDCTIADSIGAGIVIAPLGGSAKVVLDRVRMFNRSQGLAANGPANVTVRDSVAAGNTAEGIWANAGAKVMIDRTALVNNKNGVRSEQNGTIVYIGDSVVTGNTLGLDPALGSTIFSYQTNKLIGNTTDGSSLPVAYK